MRAEARLSVLLTASWLDMSCSGVGSLHFSGGSSCSTTTTLCRHQTNQCINSNQFKVKFKHFSNSVRHTLLDDSLFIILVHVDWMSVMNLSIISIFLSFSQWNWPLLNISLISWINWSEWLSRYFTFEYVLLLVNSYNLLLLVLNHIFRSQGVHSIPWLSLDDTYFHHNIIVLCSYELLSYFAIPCAYNNSKCKTVLNVATTPKHTPQQDLSTLSIQFCSQLTNSRKYNNK